MHAGTNGRLAWHGGVDYECFYSQTLNPPRFQKLRMISTFRCGNERDIETWRLNISFKNHEIWHKLNGKSFLNAVSTNLGHFYFHSSIISTASNQESIIMLHRLNAYYKNKKVWRGHCARLANTPTPAYVCTSNGFCESVDMNTGCGSVNGTAADW